jgi:aminoglycoside phosphotransferase (APT) family kinase protein
VSAVLTPSHTSPLVTAEVLLDRDRLSELVGRPVRAVRLRHKPGLSTTAALVAYGQDTGASVLGWATVSHAGYRDKVSNAVRRAAERGRDVTVRPVHGAGDDLLLTFGRVDTDPRLHRALDTLRPVLPSVDAAVADGRVTVLRYNPHRRLVLRVNRSVPVVLRATGAKVASPDRLLRSLHRAGVPVLRPVRVEDLPTTPRTSVWPWFGAGTLATAPGPRRMATDTGAALARLHAVRPPRGLPSWTRQGEEDALAGQVHALAHLDEAAASTMAALCGTVLNRLPDRPVVTVHGDLSADQVLADPWHGVRLTDFDRAAAAPAAADLGSFAAVELLPGGSGTDGLTEDVLEAYGSAGGAPVPEAELRAWTARALLHRVHEPFRQGDPQWRGRITARLQQVQEVLG